MGALARELKDRDAQVINLRTELQHLMAQVSQMRVQLAHEDGPKTAPTDTEALRMRAEGADQAWSEAADLKKELERARATLLTTSQELEAVKAQVGHVGGTAQEAPPSADVAELQRQLAELKAQVERQGREIKDKTERILRLTTRLAENRP